MVHPLQLSLCCWLHCTKPLQYSGHPHPLLLWICPGGRRFPCRGVRSRHPMTLGSLPGSGQAIPSKLIYSYILSFNYFILLIVASPSVRPIRIEKFPKVKDLKY